MRLIEIAKQQNTKIWVDLDGVLVAFDEGVKKLTGRYPSELKKKDMWNAIYSAKDKDGKPNFFRDLDWMPDGKELWNAVKPYNPTILTGLPTGGNGKQQKIEWCEKHLGPNVPVVVVPSKDKHLYAKPGYILIDDRNDNIEAWKKAGGIGILHRSTKQTLKELEKYLPQLNEITVRSFDFTIPDFTNSVYIGDVKLGKKSLV